MLKPRAVHDEDQEQYRDLVRKVLAKEMNIDEQERAGIVGKEVWRKVGEAGMLCATVPEEYGGPGLDFRYNSVVNEEVAYAGSSAGFTLHSDIVSDYLVAYGSQDQKQAYLPRMVSGELVTAIAMTEPGTGIRPSRNPYDSQARRQPLRRQRVQDLHHQWPECRPHHRRRQDRSKPWRQGYFAGADRGWRRWVRAGPQARQDRDELGRHV